MEKLSQDEQEETGKLGKIIPLLEWGRRQGLQDVLNKIKEERSKADIGTWPSYCSQFLVDLVDWLEKETK